MFSETKIRYVFDKDKESYKVWVSIQKGVIQQGPDVVFSVYSPGRVRAY